jgi:DNA-binding PadR family transcriptional regulator
MSAKHCKAFGLSISRRYTWAMTKALRLTAEIDPPRSDLTLGHYAILGLLRVQPTHGYEIARCFRDGTELGLVLPLDMNAVYALLKDLQAQGLIEGHQEVIGLRPARTVFHLSPNAQTRFLTWLAQPVERLRELRSAFLVKLYFCRDLGIEPTERLLAAQIQTTRAYLDHLSESQQATSAGSFARSVYASKIGAAGAALAWLDEERSALSGTA